MAGAAANGMTRITLSFLLSLLSDNNLGPNSPANSKHHWSYKGPEGPEFWPINYKGCAGLKQSPIDIDTSQTVYDGNLGKFHLDNFHTYSETNGPTMLNVTNNGHAASVRVTSNMRVSGGGLNGTYKTAEFHFHWGSSDNVGSEHALDGHKFPLEMHIVNYAEKYGNIKDAMTEPDGLAVLGVFFELSDTDNHEFSGLRDALTYVQKAGEHNLVQRVRLRSLLPEDISSYWRYSGSLTTPMCFESVTWTVFATPQKISRSQLDTLRSLLHENGHDKSIHPRDDIPLPSRLVDNWRPLQPLNGRTVYRSFDDSYVSRTRYYNPTTRYNAIGTKPANRRLTPSEQPASQHLYVNVNANLASATHQSEPNSFPFTPKSKLKIDPTSEPGTNSVASFARPISSNDAHKSYKDALIDFTRTQYQTEMKGDLELPGMTNDFNWNKNNEALQELQKQQKLIEMQTHQQLQKLVQLRQQQQRLNNQMGSQQFGSMSSLLPNVQTLEAQIQQGQSAIQGETGTLFRNGARILNDGTRRGIDTSWQRLQNQANPSYQNRLQQNQQQKQTSNSSPTSTSSQTQQRYVKPIDPSFLLSFRPDGFTRQNQPAFPPKPQYLPQPRTLVTKESPTPSYALNSQFQNPTQISDINKSLFSQLRNPQIPRKNTPPAGFQQQLYQNYPKQPSVSQNQRVIPRQQQQQQVSGSKMTSGQLRSLLEKLSSNTRQPDGPQTLMSPAARMLPQIRDVNSLSRSGGPGARGTPNSMDRAMDIQRLSDTRHSGQSRNRILPTMTSGMNPIPSNRRLQRVPGQLPSQIPPRLKATPSSSSKLQSLPSATPLSSSSPSSPSTSYNYGNQLTQQYSMNRQAGSFNRQGVNNNWYFSDTNGQAEQEELPYVFLHHIQKPVRIRRPFYERLYNI